MTTIQRLSERCVHAPRVVFRPGRLTGSCRSARGKVREGFIVEDGEEPEERERRRRERKKRRREEREEEEAGLDEEDLDLIGEANLGFQRKAPAEVVRSIAPIVTIDRSLIYPAAQAQASKART